jgi:hypothetical protein
LRLLIWLCNGVSDSLNRRISRQSYNRRQINFVESDFYRAVYPGDVHFDHDAWVWRTLLRDDAFQNALREDARRICDPDSHSITPELAITPRSPARD